MGFFGKIKENFNHGGVKVTLESPSSVSLYEGVLPISVTIVNGPETRTVKKISAQIIGSQTTNNRTSFGNDNTGTNDTQYQTIAHKDLLDEFSLAPNETKTIQLTIDGFAQADGGGAQGGALGAVFGALQQVSNMADSLGMNNWYYSVDVKVDVDGIALDPGDSQEIQLTHDKPPTTPTVVN